MAQTRKEVVDGVEVTIVEDSREDLNDFLGMAQNIEDSEGEEQQEKINEIFGNPKDQPKLTEEEKKEQEAANKRRNDEINSRVATSRANSDVAMAMQISDQIAAQSAADTPCYVVHGAKIVCSMGSREARLVVPLDHGVLLGDKPQMVDEDSQALANVMCFGNCFSVDNPMMEQAAIEATNEYNEKKSQTTWGRIKAKFGVKPKKADSVSEELKEACICECIPELISMWTDGNDKSRIDSSKTLIQPGALACKYGGIIRIIDNGQNG